MTIWVTGASGMLGKCVGETLDALKRDWIGTDLELDISNPEAVAEFCSTHQITSIANCAAYTAVDAAENDEESAMRVNGIGPEVLALKAYELGASFLHISTDYVLDGDRLGEHTEDSPVAPCNVYGVTKLRGERQVAQVFSRGAPAGTPSWYIIRTSWLFGAGRSSFVETMWNLMLSKQELSVVADQVGRPTYVRDLTGFAVSVLLAESSNRLPSGVWHYANLGATSWHGFASEIRESMLRHGLNVKVQQIREVTTEEFPRPARRPKNSVLSTKRLECAGVTLRPWQVALDEHIQGRATK